MIDNKVIAKKSDWTTKEMPEKTATFQLERFLSGEELTNLRYGNIPQEMEDKWFWYMEGDTLYAHRSWTGFCIFIMDIDINTGIHTVTVNRDKNQYSCTNINEDIELLNHLLDWWVQPKYDYYNEWLEETVENLKKSEGLKILNTGISTERAVYFHKPDEPFGFLSNWYPSDFVLDGIKFTSAEQYIMYRKCLILGDTDTANKVLTTNDVAAQQKLARNTSKYSEVIWDGMRQIVAMRGLMAKFSQNKDLLDQLTATGDAYLVECAWSDKVWACGIGLDSDDKQEMKNWKGKNILGFALMEVRSMLCAEVETSQDDVPSRMRSSVSVKQGDITAIACDCIVNAANKSLLGGGGVDGAIHRAAGPELLNECRTLGGCNTGEAKITKGYKLPAKYIIHTVGPIYSGDSSDSVFLGECYKNSLDLAKKNGIRSIAFPAISTGVYGYPLVDATEIAVKTIYQWISDNNDYAMDIVFCCFDKKTKDIYESIIVKNNEWK